MSGTQVIHSSLRRIARPVVQNPQQCRNFTTTQRRRGAGGTARNMIARQMGKERTLASKMAKAKGSDVPTDLGYFPGTLIKPDRQNLPALLSSHFTRRMRIEWTVIWQKIRDFGGAIYQMKWSVKKDPITRKPLREDMELAIRYKLARDLHKELYTALASGDRAKIAEIACTGVQKALNTRLDQRRAVGGPEETWSITYPRWTSDSAPWLLSALMPARFKSTRIITDRTGQIPIGKDGRIRQVTAKIHSIQTLNKNDGSAPTQKTVEEYVVIQKMRIDGKDDKWKIWGTTQPSTPTEVMELFRANKKDLSFMDKLSNQVDGVRT